MASVIVGASTALILERLVHTYAEMKPLYFVERNGMIPLDEAIIHSVRRSSNKLELIRKLFSTIIVVGGTARLRGFSEFLKHTYDAALKQRANTRASD